MDLSADIGNTLHLGVVGRYAQVTSEPIARVFTVSVILEAVMRKGQRQLSEQQQKDLSHLNPVAQPQELPGTAQPVSRKSHKLARRTSSKAGTIRGASPKTLAARKAAKK
jgi:hypothetical protein